MIRVKKFWPFILITLAVLLFFLPVFKGQIPFPGDLLVSQNPYSTQSYLGYAAGGYPNKAQGQDVINEIYPWRYFSFTQLKQESIPFWNPYNFSGNPQIANFQTALFYPFNILYFILPFNASWTFLIILQPLLAGIFMYLFLKKAVGLKDFPSFVGSISFAFCSYMIVWIEYGNIGNTILWLPLALLFTKYYFRKANLVNLLGICTSLSFAILAGYIQGVFYIYILCFLYYSYLVFSTKGSFQNHKKNLLFLVSLAFPFLITSFQVLPTLQLFSESTRGAYTLSQIEKNLSPISNLITVAIPDFFGNPATRNYWIDGTYIERVMYPGTVILFFAFYAIFNRINILEKKFFVVASFISLIIATNFPFVKYLYLIPVPVISTTVATRELSIFIFSMIVLGAIGLDYFLKENKFNKKFIYFYVIAFITLWIITFSIFKLIPNLSLSLKISLHNLFVPTLILILTIISILLRKINKKLTLFLIAVLVIFDLFYFFNKITPFAPSSLIYPKTPIISYLKNTAGINRFWGYGSAYIPPDFQSVDKTFSPEGNDPLHISRYGELLASSLNGKIPLSIPRPDANIAPGYGQNDLKSNPNRKRILDLLGVKYIVHNQDSVDAWSKPDLNTFPKDQFNLVYKIYPWQVYENKNSVPRIFITGSYMIAKDKSQSLAFIYNPNLNLSKTLILESTPTLSIDKNAKGSIKLISYKPNQVVIQASVNSNSLLFISDNYYPDWEVKIDGKLSQILLADYTFRAVEVPKGNHVIEFFYDAKDFKAGLVLAVFGLIVLLGAYIYAKNNKKTF